MFKPSTHQNDGRNVADVSLNRLIETAKSDRAGGNIVSVRWQMPLGHKKLRDAWILMDLPRRHHGDATPF